MMGDMDGVMGRAAVSWWYWSAAVLLGTALWTLDIWILVAVTP